MDRISAPNSLADRDSRQFPCQKLSCKRPGATCILISMPELPDVEAYVTALESRIVGEPLQRVRLASAFSCEPCNHRLPAWRAEYVRELRRVGKRSRLD